MGHIFESNEESSTSIQGISTKNYNTPIEPLIATKQNALNYQDSLYEIETINDELMICYTPQTR